MSQLIKSQEIAGELVSFLEQQVAEGHQWVVYDTDNPISSTWDLHCFWEHSDALDFEREYQQIFNWHVAVPINELCRVLKEIEHSFKNKNMNRNSLEDFKDQAKTLKIPAAMQEEIIKQMENNTPLIAVTTQLPSAKGYLEATAHLKRSGGDSEYYYLNRYDLAYNNQAKPVENGYQYAVKSDSIDGRILPKPSIQRFDSPIAAIAYFNQQKGNSELLTAKLDGTKVIEGQSLATMKDGKVDYIVKEFQPTFKNEPIRNTVFVNQGTGFSMTQSSNMLQRGSAYRDDLVSRQGAKYEAWNTYRFDEPRDNYGNLKIKQYSEGYGFNLQKQLDNYMIKEMDNPKAAKELIAELKDGGRPVVDVVNDQGESMRLRVQAMPRFGNLNFYQLNGKPENREQFQRERKEESLGQENNSSKKLNQGKDKDAVKAQEMSM